MMLTLAEESPVIADQHPPPVEFEARGADRRAVDFNATARLQRVDNEIADPDQS